MNELKPCSTCGEKDGYIAHLKELRELDAARIKELEAALAEIANHECTELPATGFRSLKDGETETCENCEEMKNIAQNALNGMK